LIAPSVLRSGLLRVLGLLGLPPLLMLLRLRP